MLGFWLTRDAGAEPKKCGLLDKGPHFLLVQYCAYNEIYFYSKKMDI